MKNRQSIKHTSKDDSLEDCAQSKWHIKERVLSGGIFTHNPNSIRTYATLM